MAPPILTANAVRALSDSELLDTQRALARQRREIDAQSALVAGEVGYRSRRDLGYSGLAQRMGARTAERLVQTMTGSSARDAATLVSVGGLEAQSPLGLAVASGGLGVDAAAVIRNGLGDDAPDDAVRGLIAAAEQLSVEKLAARARDIRSQLDEEGVVDREQLLRGRRYLRLSPVGDGMTRLSGLLDPESAAIVVAAYDGATSPHRGGPRFVDPERAAAAEQLVRDSRTTEQIALDAVIELIRIGSADSGEKLLGGPVAVRVVVSERDLLRRRGSAQIDGQTAAISISTAERQICDAAIVPVVVDTGGNVINLGRSQRLFSPRQKIALAVRDGGCRFPDCDRPPSWCEAHHLTPWSDGGRTDLADGILLCRYHHLLVHNNGWRVTRIGSDYSVVPPPSLDPDQTPIPAPSRGRIALRVAGVI